MNRRFFLIGSTVVAGACLTPALVRPALAAPYPVRLSPMFAVSTDYMVSRIWDVTDLYCRDKAKVQIRMVYPFEITRVSSIVEAEDALLASFPASRYSYNAQYDVLPSDDGGPSLSIRILRTANLIASRSRSSSATMVFTHPRALKHIWHRPEYVPLPTGLTLGRWERYSFEHARVDVPFLPDWANNIYVSDHLSDDTLYVVRVANLDGPAGLSKAARGFNVAARNPAWGGAVSADYGSAIKIAYRD